MRRPFLKRFGAVPSMVRSTSVTPDRLDPNLIVFNNLHAINFPCAAVRGDPAWNMDFIYFIHDGLRVNRISNGHG